MFDDHAAATAVVEPLDTGDEIVESLQGGWATLLGDGLKTHAETEVS